MPLKGNSAIILRDAGASNQALHMILDNQIKGTIYAQKPGLQIAHELGLRATEFIFFDKNCIFDNYIFGSNSCISEQDELLSNLNLSGIKTIGILDHWINYEKRWLKSMPAEIWVTDKYAQILANKIFKKSEIVLKENSYLNYIKDDYFSALKLNLSPNIGFLCKKNDHDSQSQNIDELKCSCPSIVSIAKNQSDHNILVKLHPSHLKVNCFTFIKKIYPNLKIYDGTHLTLAKFLANSNVVIGELTYALYLSDILGIETYICESTPHNWGGPIFRSYNLFAR